MSYQDRDLYRDQMREQEAWPHPLSTSRRSYRLPPFAWAIVGLAAMIGSAHLHDWWARTHVATPGATSSELRTYTPPMPEPRFEKARVPEPVARGDEPPMTRQVVRCVLNGRTAYSAAAECPSGGRTVAVDPSRSEMEGGLSEYQLQMLRSADARIVADQAAALAAPVQNSAISTNGAECAALDQQIHSLDARARNPISGYEQEVIRAERVRARSRQFELHC